jgi:hypothetical protein
LEDAMSNSQNRNDDNPSPAKTPAGEPGGRSGEGAASAMEQMISQNRQRQQDGSTKPQDSRY